MAHLLKRAWSVQEIRNKKIRNKHVYSLVHKTVLVSLIDR